MIQYEKIDVSEGIDLNKSNKSRECMIYHYWYLKDIGYKYEQHVCNGCHDLSMMVFDLDDFDFMIVNIKGVAYDAIKLLINSLLDIKVYHHGFWCKCNTC